MRSRRRKAASALSGRMKAREGIAILAGMKAHVWVMPKRTVLDPQGKTIQQALSSLGYAQISDVRQGKFFVLNLEGWNRDEAQKQVERISKEVLANPVIEEYRFEIVD
jgi:phosphoribosylformylglycinamidine synthase